MNLGQLHQIPSLAPVDQANGALQSDVVDAGEANEIEFDVMFGVITGDVVTITIEECNNNTPSLTTAIAFNYQKSSAVGTDVMGAVTAATSSGVELAASDDGKMVRCYVDPKALTDGRPYVRAVVTPGGSMSVCLVAINTLVRPRYPQEVPGSLVD